MRPLLFLVFICVLVVQKCYNARLKLVRTNSTLPKALATPSVVYNGQDSIFVIGGYNETANQDSVIKYTLDSGEVELIGTFIPIAYGSSVMDGDYILYFGGYSIDKGYSSSIYRYSTTSNTFQSVNQLPSARSHQTIAWDSTHRVAYLFGGQNLPVQFDSVLAYNGNNNIIRQIGKLRYHVSASKAVWIADANIALIFGGDRDHQATRDILMFNPSNGDDSHLTDLPVNGRYSCAAHVTGGNEDGTDDVYLVGRDIFTGHNTMIRFNLDTQKVDEVEVEPWPYKLKYLGCTYVPRLNRIYIFGGVGSIDGEPEAFRDEIFYVDLNNTKAKSEENKKSYTIIILAVVATLILSSIATFCLIYVKRTKCTGKDEVITTAEHGKYELDWAALIMDQDNPIGMGQFGIVFKGRYGEIDVAVKTIKPNARDITTCTSNYGESSDIQMKSLLMELKILTFLGPHAHPHLVNLIGAHTTRIDDGILYLVTELCPLGDLETFLRARKHSFRACSRCGTKNLQNNKSQLASPCVHASSYIQASDLDSISTCDLFLWSTQTANAMSFLSAKKVVHGDLATRNILLRDKSCAKVTDFGLGKKMYIYARTDECSSEAKMTSALPWRSLAPEVLVDLKLSSQSDVWSFGVTLWEIFSLGAVPYTGALNYSADFSQQLLDGLRLQTPPHAPGALYNEMERCWNVDPDARPSFPELCNKIEELRQRCTSKPSKLHDEDSSLTN